MDSYVFLDAVFIFVTVFYQTFLISVIINFFKEKYSTKHDGNNYKMIVLSNKRLAINNRIEYINLINYHNCRNRII